MPIHRRVFAALLFIGGTIVISGGRAQAGDWGNLKGRFVYDGMVPAAVPIGVGAAAGVCGNGLVQEDLVVKADGSLANVAIYVKGKVDVHPDYKKSDSDTVVLDNKDCRFEPHFQGIRVGQTLQLKNSDSVAHNTNIAGRFLQTNPLIPSGATSELKVEAVENVPAMVSCNIHPWMKARLLVRSNPYFAISNKDGAFEIKNLPAGEIEFQVYQEKCGYVQDALLNGNKVNWPKGVFKVTVQGDKTTDLGDIKLPAAQFNK